MFEVEQGQLPRTRLGTSGLTVSRLGLGLAALGRPAYLNLGHAEDLGADVSRAALQRRTCEMLDAARAAGVTYFDAARSYGLAESFLAHYRDVSQVNDWVLGSKWGYVYTGNWQLHADEHEVKRHELKVLEQQLAETRSLLGEEVRLYQVHSATLQSGVLENAGILERLRRLRREGMVIGLTVSGPDQAAAIERALEIRFEQQPLFQVVQATWNLLERSAEEALAQAHDAGLGILVKEPMANGRLARRSRRFLASEAWDLLGSAAEERETTADALALAAAVARPWADCVLMGVTRLDHLFSNLRCLQIDWSGSLESTFAGLRETPGGYWQTRARLEWN